MTSRDFFRRVMLTIAAGAAALVVAMPMTAMAHERDHFDRGRHLGWYHHGHDRDRDDCDFNRGTWFRRPSGYYGTPVQPPYWQRNNPRLNYLQQKWMRAKAAHEAAVASGHRQAAKITSDRLYELNREMKKAGGYGGYPYSQPYYNQGYGVAPALADMFGIW